MVKRLLGALALTGVAVYLFFFYLAGGSSDAKQRGIKVDATVLNKNSVPGPDGQMQYSVSFVFRDADGRNRQVNKMLRNEGAYNRLEVGKDIKVYYLIENANDATLDGAADSVPPKSDAMSFLGWTALIGALALWAGLLKPYLIDEKAPKSGGSVSDITQPYPDPNDPNRPKPRITVTRK